MAYTQAIAGKKGTRYRGFHLDPNGRYKSAGTYGTEERALEDAQQAEKHAPAASVLPITKREAKTGNTRALRSHTLNPNKSPYVPIC